MSAPEIARDPDAQLVVLVAQDLAQDDPIVQTPFEHLSPSMRDVLLRRARVALASVRRHTAAPAE